MKKVNQISMLILMSVFVFAFSNANAQKSDCASSKSKTGSLENIIPDLTDKQKEEIKTLRTAHLKESQQIKNQMDIKRAELKALQTAEKADLDAINKKIEEKSALRTDLEKKHSAHKQAVRSLLTDDQKVIYDQKTSRRSAHKCGSHKGGKSCDGAKKEPCNKPCKK